ncbi:ribonuclease P protein component [Trueperella bonasi]|uniref:Ribonuclease P protein component n=1 Tax=Trueperella bonasi TaxID=312286 RepID=A0ABT9NG17_9ACTO|nr:ribonuclease P protein component [Trueperella bonasi]MDP9806345.1 ribonuclease P protein component [Trueperella bonasi]
MLPAVNRMRDSADFRSATRKGLRSACRYFVIHVVAGNPEADLLVGFTVSKKVGNAVTRNRVRRRLRHIMREYLDVPAEKIVIRALPVSATASSGELRHALHSALVRLGIIHD